MVNLFISSITRTQRVNWYGHLEGPRLIHLTTFISVTLMMLFTINTGLVKEGESLGKLIENSS